MAQIVDIKDSKRDLETYAIIGAAMMVHRQRGRGFLELVYHEALEVELGTRGIPYRREVEIQIQWAEDFCSTSEPSHFNTEGSSVHLCNRCNLWIPQAPPEELPLPAIRYRLSVKLSVVPVDR